MEQPHCLQTERILIACLLLRGDSEVYDSVCSKINEDDFYDRYGTASRIVSAGISADNLRKSGEQAELGGLLNAELTLARRGIV